MDSLWHQLRLEDRRLRAAQLGVKVSDLEEMEELQETLAESAHEMQTVATPQNQRRAYEVPNIVGPGSGANSHTDTHNMNIEPEVEEDHDSQYFDKDSVLFRRLAKPQAKVSSQDVTLTALTLDSQDGGRWHTLPQEVVDRILVILGDIDMMGYLCMASKSTFHPSDAVYQYLCAITYPMQTSRRTLQVENWLTWRNMLIHRPRLRMNGFYTLRTKYSKGYCNDHFWEEKQFKSIEVRSYCCDNG
jgi:hypothetical protein